MPLENIEQLVELSKRSDFEELYQKYALRKEFDFLRKATDMAQARKWWELFRSKQERDLVALYRSIFSESFETLKAFLENYPSFFDSQALLTTIENYLGVNISALSGGIFNAEIRNFDGTLEDYLSALAQDYEKFRNIIEKYPYWYQLIENFLVDTETFLKDFLGQLIADRGNILKTFFGEESALINNIVLSMGDRHRGRFVIEVKTEVGDFFYKPRTAGVDLAFKKVLDKLSENEAILTMMSPEFIEGGTYSWFKKVAFRPLTEKDNRRHYYRRLGQLVALIYILNGNDIHHENLISQGEHPIIVDIETLLTNTLMLKKTSTPAYLQQDENSYMFDSVKNSMVLPGLLKFKDQHFDLSPLKMVRREEVVELDKSTNHAVEETEIVMVSEEVNAGFAAVYQEIVNNKDFYKDYLKTVFGSVTVRFLNKVTAQYGSIRDLLTNPVCLFDPTYAFAISTYLYETGVKDIKTEELFEQEELLKFNIPYFEVAANAKDLILSEDRILPDYFVKTPLESLQTKLDILGEKDFKRQSLTIQKTFEVVSPEFEIRELHEVREEEKNVQLPISAQRIEQFNQRIIHRIFGQAIENAYTGQYFWIDPMLEGDEETGEPIYQVSDALNGYYTGNIGILRTLLGMHNFENYQSYIDKLRQDIEQELVSIFAFNQGEMNVGAYNGLASYLRFYSDLYRKNQIDSAYLHTQVNALIDQLEMSIDQDNKLDILDGTAGVSLALLEVEPLIRDAVLLGKISNLLKHCYQHLLDGIDYQEEDAFFPIEFDKAHYFTGFAHGSCGIIMTMYKLSKRLEITGNQSTIQKLLKTERKYYDAEQKVWYRGNKTDAHSWGWCHGIPGILLSRLELYLDGYRDDYLESELQELYEITIEKALGSNLTFCHGDLSNILIVKYAQKVLNKEDDRVDNYLSQILPYILKSDDYHIRGTEAVGLMYGLAGIVIFLDTFVLQKNLNALDILKITSIQK